MMTRMARMTHDGQDDQDDGYDEEAIRAHEQLYANDNGIMDCALNPAGDNWWSRGGNHGHCSGEDIWAGDANDSRLTQKTSGIQPW